MNDTRRAQPPSPPPDDPVTIAGQDSFPASDPPAWTLARIGPAAVGETAETDRRQGVDAARPPGSRQSDRNGEPSPAPALPEEPVRSGHRGSGSRRMADSGTVSAGSARIEAMNGVLADNWWAAALRGLLAVSFGVLAFVMPGITMVSLALVFAAYCLVDGVAAIIMAVRGARQGERWVWLLLGGLLGILAAAITAIWPGLTVLAFVYVVAAWALLSGILMLVSAVRLRKDHGRISLAAAGVAGMTLGILLAISPLSGALALTFWIGAHALILGGFLLLLAYRLYSKRTVSPPHVAPARVG